MVGLLLRKKRQPPHNASTDSPPAKRELSHSLSLPDLTTPLLDPSSWEEIPDFHKNTIPSLPNSSSAPSGLATTARAIFSHNASPPGVRNRAPSFVGGGVAFHKPFGTWQVVGHTGAEGFGTALPAEYKGDFRKSTSNRDSVGSTVYHGLGHQTRRRKKGRVAESLNVILVGGKGVGKTSFLNLLRDTNDSSIDIPPTRYLSPTKIVQTPSSPTSPGPPITPSSISTTPPLSPSTPHQSPPQLQRPKPTLRLSSSSITLDRPAEKIQLNIIDTPGLDLRSDDGPAVHARQRERGVQAILNVAEERLGEVLREESKVVRRQLSGGGGLIHLCVYLIDARVVLHPVEDGVEVDWSGLVLDNTLAESGGMENLNPKLSKIEVDIIRRLGDRVNVLPILTHADHLSIPELAAVRAAVRRDLGEAFVDVEGRGFGLFGSSSEDDTVGRKISNSKLPTMIDDAAYSGMTINGDTSPSLPLSPTSMIHSQSDDDPNLPYAIFSPSVSSGGGGREYNWGEANVAEHSDLDMLRKAILDVHAKALRTTTREVLYEQYRTERLLAKRGRIEIQEKGQLADDISMEL